MVIGIASTAGTTRALARDDDPLQEQLHGWLAPVPIAETLVRGQMGDVPPPATILPLPVGRPRLDQGGFYVGHADVEDNVAHVAGTSADAARGMDFARNGDRPKAIDQLSAAVIRLKRQVLPGIATIPDEDARRAAEAAMAGRRAFRRGRKNKNREPSIF